MTTKRQSEPDINSILDLEVQSFFFIIGGSFLLLTALRTGLQPRPVSR